MGLARDVSLPGGHVTGTELLNTCCKDIGYIRPFDRIVANFGTLSNSTLLFDTMPAWAQGQMHNGVIASLVGFQSPAAAETKFSAGVVADNWQVRRRTALA